MGRKPTNAIVTRRYRADETSCAEALRLLLDYARNRDRRPDTDDACNAKGSSDEVRAESSIQR